MGLSTKTPNTDFTDEKEHDQADAMVHLGTKKLVQTEDGREKLREGSFNIDETAKVILEAAEEIVAEESIDESLGRQAKETREKIQQGTSNGLTEKVKGRVVGSFGQAD